MSTSFAGSWTFSREISFGDALTTSSIQAEKTIRPFTQLTYFGAVTLFLNVFFLNLIKNSIESIQQKTEKVNDFNKNITIELNDFDSHISLIINDNGIGFKNLNNNIKEILNPYFTTKKQGTGLGLSIVNKIINDHNGNIEFIPKEDGAMIKITFIK